MRTEIRLTEPKRLLTPASGFLLGYSHTLNPYAGCAFACSYCYVREMPVAKFRGEPWGGWADVKANAAERLEKELAAARKKGPVTLFMSSATDPWQPIEARFRLTRSLIEVMNRIKPDFLFVQTRSPLITRDIDLLAGLRDRMLISMTVETDLEQVRRAFTPHAPPLAARFKALRRLKEAGLHVQAAVAPVLPCSDRFPALLAETADRVVLDDYFQGDGSGGKRTGRLNVRRIYRELGLEHWYDPRTLARLAERFAACFPPDRLRISRDGFMPPEGRLTSAGCPDASRSDDPDSAR